MSEPSKHPSIRIHKWNNLKAQFGRLETAPRPLAHYIFRGQADESWSLEPTILRYAKQVSADTDRVLPIEQAARKTFESQASLHISDAILRHLSTDMGWWTLMQHYRAPTRILDWTVSPYVAAYFAAESCFDRPGAVWAIHVPTLQNVMNKRIKAAGIEIDQHKTFLDPSAPDILLAREPATKTDRMVAQQGAFTVCTNVLADHAKILDEIVPENPDPAVFQKYTFPADQKPLMLHELSQMNITAASLFPGVDGLGRSIAELVRLGLRAFRKKSDDSDG